MCARSRGPDDSRTPAEPAQLTIKLPAKVTVDPKERLQDSLSLLRGPIECDSCNAQVSRKPGKVSFNNVGVDPTSEVLRLCHLTCSKCYTVICAGCGEASECEADCESDQANGCATAGHCAKVRAVLLFEALATFDRLYLEIKRPLSSAHPTKKAKAGAGVGYGAVFALFGWATRLTHFQVMATALNQNTKIT
jgi:hypothetical protein